MTNNQNWAERILNMPEYTKFKGDITFTDENVLLIVSFTFSDHFSPSETPKSEIHVREQLIEDLSQDLCTTFFKDTQFKYGDSQHFDDGTYGRDYVIPIDVESFRADFIRVLERLNQR